MPKAAACICCLIGRAERVGFMNKYDGYWMQSKHVKQRFGGGVHGDDGPQVIFRVKLLLSMQFQWKLVGRRGGILQSSRWWKQTRNRQALICRTIQWKYSKVAND